MFYIYNLSSLLQTRKDHDNYDNLLCRQLRKYVTISYPCDDLS